LPAVDSDGAQGDGEVCVTGIECPMTRFVSPAARLQPAGDAAGYLRQ